MRYTDTHTSVGFLSLFYEQIFHVLLRFNRKLWNSSSHVGFMNGRGGGGGVWLGNDLRVREFCSTFDETPNEAKIERRECLASLKG